MEATSRRGRDTPITATTKLCGFIQQSAKSESTLLKLWAFRDETALLLFGFYTDWNEENQYRSMKLVLDVVALLITQNPRAESGRAIKDHILDTLLPTLLRRPNKQRVKLSMASLNYLLTKGSCSVGDITSGCSRLHPPAAALSTLALWGTLIRDMYYWMGSQYVCPVAGKLLGTVFRRLREPGETTAPAHGAGLITAELWLSWLQEAVVASPDILENIKNYLLLPLFKSDREGSLQLLLHLAVPRPESNGDGHELSTSALLRLAALQIGKKAGLVNDPGTLFRASRVAVYPSWLTDEWFTDPLHLGKPSKAVVLHEQMLENGLGHPSPEVRALALAVLVSSASTSRPYSADAFDLLREHIPRYYADPDAKFRHEVLGHTKNMVMRIRGAMFMLKRTTTAQPAPTAVAGKTGGLGAGKAEGMDPGEMAGPPPSNRLPSADTVQDTLDRHEKFFGWYMTFLRNELIPPASYQRHIAALKATEAVFARKKDHPDGSDAAMGSVYHDFVWIRSILDLIMDAFDDVREAATTLLTSFPDDVVKEPLAGDGRERSPTLLAVLHGFCHRADDHASRTGRADHADGAARARGLLCAWTQGFGARINVLEHVLDALEANLSLAEVDLGQAALESPVHGAFASVRLVAQHSTTIVPH